MQGIACRRFPFLCSSSIPSSSIGWQNVTTANYLITSNSTVPRRVYCIQIGCRNKNVLFKFPSLEFHLNQPPHFFNQMNRTWLLTTEGEFNLGTTRKENAKRCRHGCGLAPFYWQIKSSIIRQLEINKFPTRSSSPCFEYLIRCTIPWTTK